MVDVLLEFESGGSDEERAKDDDGGVAEGEHESDGDGALAFLHELAGDVVDGRDVVGIDGVAEAEGVGEEGGSEENGEVVEGGDGPEPCGGVDEDEERVDAGNLATDVVSVVVEEAAEGRGHGELGSGGGCVFGGEPKLDQF
jgi:hypothetical protein